MMAPILTNAEVQQRLLPFLPSGESLLQSADEIQSTINSPQFQQVTDEHKVDPNKYVDIHVWEKYNLGEVEDIMADGVTGKSQTPDLWNFLLRNRQ